MLPIRLNTRRPASGFQFDSDRPGVLVADALSFEPLTIETPNLEDPLILRLANCTTDDDLVRFCDRYFDRQELTIESLRDYAEGLRLMVVQTLHAKLAPPLRWGDPRFVDTLLAEVKLQPRLRRLDGVSRLVLEASSVQDFMAIEIAAALEAGVRATNCQHCDKLFLFGPFTGRRSHGKFCGDKCRVGAMRKRAKEASQ